MTGFLADYEPVEDRLRAFWKEHPDGRIETVLLGDAEGRYLVEARAYRDLRDPAPSASGLAMERETERGVNATSALENCETSAIGRALANLGYAAKGKRPSREEMSKASGSPPSASVPPGPTQQTAPEEAGAGDRKVTGKGQPTPAPATPEQWAQAVSIGLTEAKRNAVARSLGILANVTDMTGEQLDRIIAAYLEIQEKKKAS